MTRELQFNPRIKARRQNYRVGILDDDTLYLE